MKRKMLLASTAPLLSLSLLTATPAFSSFAEPIIVAQAESQSACAEDDAECKKREEEEKAGEQEQEPAAEETQPDAGQAEPPAEEVIPEDKPAAEEAAPAAEEPAAGQEGEAPAPEETEPSAEEQPADQQAEEPAPVENVVPDEKPAAEEPSQSAEDAPAESTEEPAEVKEAPNEEPSAASEEEVTSDPEQEDGPVIKKEGEPEAQAETAPESGDQEPHVDEGAPAAEQGTEAPKTELKIDEEKLRIAEDPENAEGVIELPVEDGAPVLDSAKEAAPVESTAEAAPEPKAMAIPESDEQAQSLSAETEAAPAPRSALRQSGERLRREPEYDMLEGRVEGQQDGRMILDFGNGITLRYDDKTRISRDARESYYEELPGGYTRQVVERRNGDEVVTIRNRWGEIVQRSRIRDGVEYVLYYDPEGFRGERRPNRAEYYDSGRDLPPMRLRVPLSDYIIDMSSDRDRDYEAFLAKPPVEPVERIYSLNEVAHSARIRDKVRRIDLDTIRFETGSAAVSSAQARSLRRVADAINALLEQDPGETFLIEGHTDAVGSDRSNLILSDQRAESVADILTEFFDVPPENLATQGYGERYLKVRTEAAEPLNRRVTIRRVTPLVRPVSAKVID